MQEKEQCFEKKKIWIFAGETSGDNYGASLACALKSRGNMQIQGMGGQAMRKAGVDILVDSTTLGVVGIVEVVKNLRQFLHIYHYLIEKAIEERPDVIVLIDYPGFNLRYAKRINKEGIPVVYYISPQIWAWRSERIKTIVSCVKKMLVIFPFEKPLYENAGLETVFVGHPLVDMLTVSQDTAIQRDKNLIILLPGSRFSEVDRLMEPLYQTAREFYQKHSRYRFVIAVPNKKIKARILEIRNTISPSVNHLPIKIVDNETEFWMRKAIAGIAASGTVTIQAAILQLPLVVVYKLHPITYFFGKKMVKVPYVTMVNILGKECIYEEFLQEKVCPPFLVPALETILLGGKRREQSLKALKKVVLQLKGKGNASKCAAEEILKI